MAGAGVPVVARVGHRETLEKFDECRPVKSPDRSRRALSGSGWSDDSAPPIHAAKTRMLASAETLSLRKTTE